MKPQLSLLSFKVDYCACHKVHSANTYTVEDYVYDRVAQKLCIITQIY